MIISRAEIASVLSAYKTVKKKAAVGSVAFETNDSFERSEAAAALGPLTAAVSAEPFYRPNLVEHLRRQISDGHYFVPAEKIVEKMLGRLMVEAAAA